MSSSIFFLSCSGAITSAKLIINPEITSVFLHVSSTWVGLSQGKRGGAVKRVVCREIGGGGGGERGKVQTRKFSLEGVRLFSGIKVLNLIKGSDTHGTSCVGQGKIRGGGVMW